MSAPPNFKSGFERTVHARLENTGVDFKYESLKLPYFIEHLYLPDWVITLHTGKTIVIEAKGYMFPGTKKKMETVKEQNPGVDIRFVFQDASLPIRKGAKMTYGDWATKKGFPWAEGSVPLEWLADEQPSAIS